MSDVSQEEVSRVMAALAHKQKGKPSAAQRKARSENLKAYHASRKPVRNLDTSPSYNQHTP